MMPPHTSKTLIDAFSDGGTTATYSVISIGECDVISSKVS